MGLPRWIYSVLIHPKRIGCRFKFFFCGLFGRGDMITLLIGLILSGLLNHLNKGRTCSKLLSITTRNFDQPQRSNYCKGLVMSNWSLILIFIPVLLTKSNLYVENPISICDEQKNRDKQFKRMRNETERPDYRVSKNYPRIDIIYSRKIYLQIINY
ncbi:hypothetical protein HS088_TW15G00074 [Tripterygium wilfordii]|uniref:Uncharacterized protein n=1 Tax=Tripterygium wilfordii TaxID=458696 RepID=A0A7J7CKJ5_TRIWF|nr:hypothetical protein HS088_TW15G00074 [Tripterygium wilfordii]